jgi:RND family efflux transporter MFP subunit
MSLTALLALLACAEPPAPPRPSAVPVLVEDVARGSVAVHVELPGELRSPSESVAAAEISGVVLAAPVRAGQSVKRGDLLVRLDDRPQQIAVTQARARLEQARAQEEVRAAALERVRVTSARLLEVSTRDPAAVSARDLEDATLAVAEAEAAQRAAAADVAVRVAEVDAAALDLTRTRMLAPTDGVVARQDARIGQRVAPGVELVRLAGAGPLEGLFDVGESQGARVRVGAPVEVFVDVRGGVPWVGTLAGVVPAADGTARNQRARTAISPVPEGWVAGLAARARVEVERLENALTVPRDALTQGAVFRVTDGKATKVPVTVLHELEGRLVVTGALEEGDDVVVRGNEALSDGAAVTVVGPGGAPGGAPPAGSASGAPPASPKP